jgi:hypothetical protein
MAIYFGYLTMERFAINLEIPEGYMVESLPAPVRVTLGDKEIVFSLNTSSDGNKIQILSTKEINSSIFAPDAYQGLKDLFQKMIASQNEKIILKKN